MLQLQWHYRLTLQWHYWLVMWSVMVVCHARPRHHHCPLLHRTCFSDVSQAFWISGSGDSATVRGLCPCLHLASCCGCDACRVSEEHHNETVMMALWQPPGSHVHWGAFRQT